MTRHEELTDLVAAADDDGMVRTVVERSFQDLLQGRVLLLDDQHLLESGGELACLGGIEWHRHQELEQTDPCRSKVVVRVEAEHTERLSNLVERLSARGDAEPVVVGPNDHPVELVLDAVAAGELPAHLLELALHLDGVGSEETAVRSRPERRTVDLDLGRDRAQSGPDGPRSSRSRRPPP